ncbi:MAG: hypothetical protein NTW30_06295 [Candidatus Aenigmarchaeota archaeon]|nr:hypothetical protein [Candidatus Aenigmarchaeota archaeon]
MNDDKMMISEKELLRLMTQAFDEGITGFTETRDSTIDTIFEKWKKKYDALLVKEKKQVIAKWTVDDKPRTLQRNTVGGVGPWGEPIIPSSSYANSSYASTASSSGSVIVVDNNSSPQQYGVVYPLTSTSTTNGTWAYSDEAIQDYARVGIDVAQSPPLQRGRTTLQEDVPVDSEVHDTQAALEGLQRRIAVSRNGPTTNSIIEALRANSIMEAMRENEAQDRAASVNNFLFGQPPSNSNSEVEATQRGRSLIELGAKLLATERLQQRLETLAHEMGAAYDPQDAMEESIYNYPTGANISWSQTPLEDFSASIHREIEEINRNIQDQEGQ